MLGRDGICARSLAQCVLPTDGGGGGPHEMHRRRITRNSRRGSQNGWRCLIDHSGTQSHHPPLQSRLHAHARLRATPLPTTTRLSSAPPSTRLHNKTAATPPEANRKCWNCGILFLFTSRGESSLTSSKDYHISKQVTIVCC